MYVAFLYVSYNCIFPLFMLWIQLPVFFVLPSAFSVVIDISLENICMSLCFFILCSFAL